MKSVPIQRWSESGGRVEAEDFVAVEEPLEIRVDGKSVSVVMRTPGHDEELAVGFLVTEGILRVPGGVKRIQPYPRNDAGNVVDVFLEDGITWDPGRLTRHVFAASSCGLCGKTSIESIRCAFPPVLNDWKMEPGWVVSLPERLRSSQSVFERTGGLHAAGLFGANAESDCVREDIGRHNAVDKVIGRRYLDAAWPIDRHALVVSGRTSFEILQKALAAGIPLVAGVGAPSSLAVEFAMENRITLVGFIREGRMNIYVDEPGRLRK